MLLLCCTGILQTIVLPRIFFIILVVHYAMFITSEGSNIKQYSVNKQPEQNCDSFQTKPYINNHSKANIITCLDELYYHPLETILSK